MAPGATFLTRTLAVITVFSYTAHSWTSVRISTCDPPVSSKLFSACCFLENVPPSASIYFSRKGRYDLSPLHVLRIGPPCKRLYPTDDFDFDFTEHCNTIGTVANYSIRYEFKTFGDEEHSTWSCGFYGNSSSLEIDNLLTSHEGFETKLPGQNASLSWKLIDFIVVRVTLYSPSRVKLLEVNWETKNVTFNANNTKYSITHLGDPFTVLIMNVQPADNGTYTVEYSPYDVILGQTLVILGKPRTPTIEQYTNWKHDSSKNVWTGTVLCKTVSGSAAPLYYKPDMKYNWRVPDPNDNSGFQTTNSSFTNGLILTVDCNKKTSLPVYCSVVEESLTADSAPWVPHSVCDNTLATTVSPEGDSSGPLIVVTIVATTFFVFSVVISLVIGRRRVKRCSRKMFKSCRSCCSVCEKCISSDDSDSDIDIDRELSGGRRLGGGRRDRRRDDFLRFDSDRSLGDNSNLGLADGLRRGRRERDSAVDRAMEQIAIEESREMAQNRPIDGSRAATNDYDNGGLNVDLPPLSPGLSLGDVNIADDNTDAGGGVELGAVGGAPLPSRPTYEESVSALKEVENLLEQHHRHLRRETVTLDVKRDLIVDNLLAYYTEETVALSRVTVKMVDEQGLDCGGVTADMFTTFWYRAREQFFIGCDKVVPFLHAHRFEEDTKFRTLGRILSHTVAVMKEIPIPMCKSTIIGMIYNTSEVAPEVVLDDFLYFLDVHDRTLVTAALNDFNSLSTDQTAELSTLFERFDYGGILKRDTFAKHLILMARQVVLIRPRPLLELMRSGLPEPHLTHFWSRFHLETLDVLFQALEPTPERIITRLKTAKSYEDLSRNQKRVFGFLKDFIKEMSDPELETFLQFITGRKSTPREPIVIDFTHETGMKRMPKAHTCSNLMELSDTYGSYDKFRSEFKNLLAADETMTMTME